VEVSMLMNQVSTQSVGTCTVVCVIENCQENCMGHKASFGTLPAVEGACPTHLSSK
jgi:hypothetical protein